MAKAFKYGVKGISGYLEPAERELLRSLFDDVVSMLEPEERANEDPLAALVGLDTEAREPTDRALRRLLPSVSKNDAAASLEFRRYTERSLRESKIGALKAASLGLDKDDLVLTPDDARHWSMALNDVRLVLAAPHVDRPFDLLLHAIEIPNRPRFDDVWEVWLLRTAAQRARRAGLEDRATRAEAHADAQVARLPADLQARVPPPAG